MRPFGEIGDQRVLARSLGHGVEAEKEQPRRLALADFRQHGAELPPEKKKRLEEIEKELVD